VKGEDALRRRSRAKGCLPLRAFSTHVRRHSRASLVRPSGGPVLRPRYRRWRVLAAVASVTLSVVLLIWSLIPVYNMLLIALDPEEGDIEFEGVIWPSDPSLHSFYAVLTQGYWLVEDFWHQFGNSFCIGLMTMFLTVLIGSLTSFALGRMRLSQSWLLVNAPLLTYAVPASFLIIPFTRIMASYGLSNTLWAIIAADVTFATPYAILILQQYAKLIPIELDEAAQVDGASPVQVYLRLYLPLMAPALAAVGTFALLLAWNEYLYQYMLLSSTRNTTVAVAIAQFFNSDEAPWNYMMATAIMYALPPIAIFYALHRYMAPGLTMGALRG
jgi:multiple sugar transport system permease protein